MCNGSHTYINYSAGDPFANISNEDFSIISAYSKLLDIGANLDTIYDTDYLGNLRDDTPTVGAYEYTGSAPPGCSIDSECSDGNECTNDVCSSGVCSNPSLPYGTACSSDGSECTDDICSSGVCSHIPNGNCEDNEEGLQVWLKFDEGVTKDSSENNYQVSCSSVCPGTAAGKTGNAAYFDGSTYLDLGTGMFNISDQFTIAMWVNPEVFTGTANPLIERSQYANPFRINLQDGGTIQAVVRTSATNYIYTSGAVPLSEWHHVAMTFNGSEMNFYIDGEPETPKPTSGFLAVSVQNTLIGKRPDASEFFNGMIDDLRIYNRSLDAGEIGILFTGVAYHKADKNMNGCIETDELLDFIDDWYYDSTENTMVELIDALDMWTRPETGCSG